MIDNGTLSIGFYDILSHYRANRHQTGASFSSLGKWGKVSYLFSLLRGGDLNIYYGVSYGSLDTAPKISNQPSVRSCLSMTPRVLNGEHAGEGPMPLR